MPRMKQAGCEHQFEDEAHCIPAFLNEYECDQCGSAWVDEWSCMCNDKCPTCNAEIEPLKSTEIACCACEHLTH